MPRPNSFIQVVFYTGLAYGIVRWTPFISMAKSGSGATLSLLKTIFETVPPEIPLSELVDPAELVPSPEVAQSIKKFLTLVPSAKIQDLYQK